MRDSVNHEGLTFEEWVCAAGVASIDDGSVGVRPYTTSQVLHRPVPGRLALVNGIVVPWLAPRRETIRYYPVRVREAWKNGEDPTEHRTPAGRRTR